MRAKNMAGSLIKQINEALERRANRDLKRIGITLSQLSVLLLLEDAPHGTMTLKELERRLCCAQSTTHGLVTRLSIKELVESREDPDDGRIRIITLTPQGFQCCEAAGQQIRAVEEELLSSLRPEDRPVFVRCLKQVNEHLIPKD